MIFYLDFSTNYQISFQDPATPIMNGIIDLHHYVMFFLFIVLIFVVINLYNIVKFFNIEIKFSAKKKFDRVYLKKLITKLKSKNTKLRINFLSYLPVKNKTHDLYLNRFETNEIKYQNFLLKYIKNMYFSNSKKLKINPKNIFFCYVLNLMYYTKLYIILKSKIFRFIHDSTIEIIWTIIPSMILIFIGLPSFILLYAMDEIIEPDFVIKCIGHQWYWSYEIEYPQIIKKDTSFFYFLLNNVDADKDTFLNIIKDTDLLKTWLNILDSEEKSLISKWDYLAFDSYMINESELPKGALRLLEVDNALIMPAETHIDLLISSSDVLHCWTIPSFGLKVDAVPGRINHANVYIERSGIFYGQCSELCGVNHGFMPIKVIVLPLEKFINNNFSI